MNKFLLPTHHTSRFQLGQNPQANSYIHNQNSSSPYNLQQVHPANDCGLEYTQRLHYNGSNEVRFPLTQNGITNPKGRMQARKVAATGTSGENLLKENYLSQASLQLHSIKEIRMQSEADNFHLKAKKPSNSQTSEDPSTCTDSADENQENKGVLSCAPPRRSRIMKFVNKDLDTYKEEHHTKLKTEICRNWEQTGMCRFGARCAFAHGTHELKSKAFLPCNYKTKICKQFKDSMYCPYGQRCQFLHILKPETNVANEDKAVKYKNLLEEVVQSNQIYSTFNRFQELKYGESRAEKRVRRLKVFEELANASASDVDGAAPSLACNLN